MGRRGEFDEGLEVFGSADRVCVKQAEDGTPIGEVCRKAVISDTTFTTGAKNTPPDALGDEASSPAHRS